MQFNFQTYIPGDTLVHRADARVKLVLLLAYSITLFLVDTWIGLSVCVAVCLVLCAVAKIPLKSLFALLVPLYVILAFTLIFNSFTFDVTRTATPGGLGAVSAGVFAGMEPIALIGSFGFIPEGFARGCFYVLRIGFLVFASLILSFSTTSTALIDALNDFMRPLKHLRVPVDDIAMIISVALRFIPITAAELFRIRDAQASRGAHFDDGGMLARIKAWQPVFVPLFVGLFRRASTLALAMETRCYGISNQRTKLHTSTFSFTSGAVLVCGLILCALCAALL
ncbi:MAG: energy-coupling factor transporter transmembrane component T family protein [Raoultibacter sp.]|jgi:energy-coupling factor transport system permease protein